MHSMLYYLCVEQEGPERLNRGDELGATGVNTCNSSVANGQGLLFVGLLHEAACFLVTR